MPWDKAEVQVSGNHTRMLNELWRVLSHMSVPSAVGGETVLWSVIRNIDCWPWRADQFRAEMHVSDLEMTSTLQRQADTNQYKSVIQKEHK